MPLRQRIAQSLSTPDKTYLSYYDANLTVGDVRSLKNDWLTDSVINFWQEYLERETLPRYPQARICLLRPSIAFLLMRSSHHDPRGVLPDLSHITHIFVPVNDNQNVRDGEGGSHWSLLLISVHDGLAFHYDSLNDANVAHGQLAARRMATVLGRRLNFIPLETPQQANGSDCGVFVCLLMRHLLVKRLLHATAREKVSMSMAGKMVDSRGGRKEMLRIIENLRKEGERRWSSLVRKEYHCYAETASDDSEPQTHSPSSYFSGTLTHSDTKKRALAYRHPSSRDSLLSNNSATSSASSSNASTSATSSGSRGSSGYSSETSSPDLSRREPREYQFSLRGISYRCERNPQRREPYPDHEQTYPHKQDYQRGGPYPNGQSGRSRYRHRNTPLCSPPVPPPMLPHPMPPHPMPPMHAGQPPWHPPPSCHESSFSYSSSSNGGPHFDYEHESNVFVRHVDAEPHVVHMPSPPLPTYGQPPYGGGFLYPSPYYA